MCTSMRSVAWAICSATARGRDRRSLKTRLLTGLIIVQTLAIMIAMIIFPLVAPFVSFDDIADATFRSRIEATLVRADAGLIVRPDAALSSYVDARSGARFAVLDINRGQVAVGSDPELRRVLQHLIPTVPRPAGNLVTTVRPGAATLIITTKETAFGRLVFATTGNAFHAEDWPSIMGAFLPILLPAYGPVIIGALVLLPLLVGYVVRPLQKLSEEATRIAPGTLNLRLDETGLGSEIQALVRSINAALDRVEQGFARQRLYAANAAHELRTPVAILALHIEDLPEGPAKSRALGDVARIATLVDQLVTVARLGQNHVAMDEAIDLVALVRDVIADRAPIAIRGGRAIAFETALETMKVAGNRQGDCGPTRNFGRSTRDARRWRDVLFRFPQM